MAPRSAAENIGPQRRSSEAELLCDQRSGHRDRLAVEAVRERDQRTKRDGDDLKRREGAGIDRARDVDDVFGFPTHVVFSVF
jgi:hypothetical protein